MIEGRSGIRDAYRDSATASSYVARRFEEPLGAMLHDAQVRRMGEIIARNRPTRVLEIAPGPARLTCDIAATLDNAGTILDASAEMLSEAQKRMRQRRVPPWRLVRGDAFNLPICGHFDLIYSFRLIRHFEEELRLELYRQIVPLLRPGGLLVFDAVNAAVANRLNSVDGHRQHYDAALTPDQIQAELHRAGFRLVHLQPIQRHYAALYRIQVLVAPRSRAVATRVMQLVERFPSGEPLEWVVTCERT